MKTTARSVTRRPICIRNNLKRARTLRKDRLYLITGQVHVPSGVRLNIEDGVRIGILNGPLPGCRLGHAALIFDAGSILDAQRFAVYAAARDGRPQKKPDNGGIWFFGGHQSVCKDGLRHKKSRRTALSHFSSKAISTHYLGCAEAEDLDAVSVMGVGISEWHIEALHIRRSGDDALDLERSDIQLRRVVIHNPTEDALNISSSHLEITDSLKVHMAIRGEPEKTKPDALDRDIFDLEVDDSPSYVSLQRGALVELSGVFGDELRLSTRDIPPFQKKGRASYRFSGRSARAKTTIYSRDQD